MTVLDEVGEVVPIQLVEQKLKRRSNDGGTPVMVYGDRGSYPARVTTCLTRAIGGGPKPFSLTICQFGGVDGWSGHYHEVDARRVSNGRIRLRAEHEPTLILDL
jgi:hypothetical protein